MSHASDRPVMEGYDLNRFFQGFVCTRPVRLKDGPYHRSFRQGAPEDYVAGQQLDLHPDALYLDLDIYLRQLKQYADTHLAKATVPLFSVIPGQVVQQLPVMPPALGQAFNQGRQSVPLLAQLQGLRREKPHQRHFRFCILAADGGLGDTLLKATAFRQLASQLKAVFPSVALDMVTLPISAPNKTDQLLSVPQLQRIVASPVTVADLAGYDGIFNLAGVLSHPRWNRMPFVDFMLWWLGIAPESVPAVQKRNHLVLAQSAWQRMAERLKTLPSARWRIVFNRKATAAVRSFPEEVAADFVRALVEHVPDLQVIVTDPLEINHPRVFVWRDLPDYHHLAALLGQVDGLIGVDSFPQHAADALNCPAVILSSTIPVETVYPYYSWQAALLIPGAEQLPAWGRAVEEAEAWPHQRAQYAQAWRRLSAELVWALLHSKIRHRLAQAPEALSPRLSWREHGTLNYSPLQRRGSIWQYRYERRTPALRQLRQAMAAWVERFVQPGMHVLWSMPGSEPAVVRACQRIGVGGRMQLHESRTVYAALQRRHLEEQGVQGRVETWLPGPDETHTVPRMVQLKEMAPLDWGNVAHLFDRVELRRMPAVSEEAVPDIVVLMPPHALRDALVGLEDLLAEHRPVLLLAGYSDRALVDISGWLQQRGYGLWQPGKDDPAMHGAFIRMALPRGHIVAGMAGWRKTTFVQTAPASA